MQLKQQVVIQVSGSPYLWNQNKQLPLPVMPKYVAPPTCNIHDIRPSIAVIVETLDDASSMPLSLEWWHHQYLTEMDNNVSYQSLHPYEYFTLKMLSKYISDLIKFNLLFFFITKSTKFHWYRGTLKH